MKALIAFFGLFTIGLSAQADSANEIHFSAQEISMQLQVRETGKMKINSMCFLLGSTGVPRRTLRAAINRSYMNAEIKLEIENRVDSIDYKVSTLAKLCDGSGSVILNSAVQPMLLTLVKKPPVFRIEETMNSIANAANEIVGLNLKALNQK